MLNTDSRLVRLEVLAAKKTNFIRRDDREASVGGELDGPGQILRLSRPPEALELDIESVRESLQPEIGGRFQPRGVATEGAS
jgi:hypothetical protein